MDTQQSEQLIENVKAYDLLYNSMHPDHKNGRKKEQMWIDIAQAMEMSDEVIRKRWKNLRDCYAKHLRAKENPSDKAFAHYRFWPWAKKMTFLKPFIQLNQGDRVSRLLKVSVKKSETRTKMHNDTVVTEFNERNSSSVEKVLKYLKNRDKTVDEIDIICKGYAKTIKKFSRRRQSIVKFKIHKMLLEAELEQQQEDELKDQDENSFGGTSAVFMLEETSELQDCASDPLEDNISVKLL